MLHMLPNGLHKLIKLTRLKADVLHGNKYTIVEQLISSTFAVTGCLLHPWCPEYIHRRDPFHPFDRHKIVCCKPNDFALLLQLFQNCSHSSQIVFEQRKIIHTIVYRKYFPSLLTQSSQGLHCHVPGHLAAKFNIDGKPFVFMRAYRWKLSEVFDMVNPNGSNTQQIRKLMKM